jgi:hypothetical protein
MKLAAAAEGQRILRVSSARWYQLAADPSFPKPIDTLSCGKIWLADDLLDYAAARLTRQPVPDQQTSRA